MRDRSAVVGRLTLRKMLDSFVAAPRLTLKRVLDSSTVVGRLTLRKMLDSFVAASRLTLKSVG